MLNVMRGALGAFLILILSVLTAPAMATDFAKPGGEVLLTLTGKISATNVDGTLQLDQALLESLPQTEFTTSSTWTSGTPTFKGVLLHDLIAAVGATGGTITLKAANDYAITMPMADVTEEAPLLAFLMDGQTMSLREKGPVWMVYPYDKDEKYRTEEVFARSIWQLVEIDFSE